MFFGFPSNINSLQIFSPFVLVLFDGVSLVNSSFEIDFGANAVHVNVSVRDKVIETGRSNC